MNLHVVVVNPFASEGFPIDKSNHRLPLDRVKSRSVTFGHERVKLCLFLFCQVCFREAVFSFNPRMIRGLYYNMPLVNAIRR